jgi:hydrogenase maturation protease
MKNRSGPASTLVIGLGNPILGDDGVGWRVAELVQANLLGLESLSEAPVEVDCLSLGGLSLMERLIDYQKVIIIDALNTGQNPPGTVMVFPLEELPDHFTGHTSAAHDTSLQTALQVGRSMGARLPDHIQIVGIESPFVYDFSEQLSEPIQAALPQAVAKVIQLLNQWMGEANDR